MRTLILILALSSIAMARFLSNELTPWQNPWGDDQKNGGCDKAEHLEVGTNSNGKFATCMPIIGSGAYTRCPAPPNFETARLDAFPVDLKEPSLKACVLECSTAKGDCPKGSTCMDAPEIFRDSYVKRICQYPQQKPVMENPWDGDEKNGDCDKMEHLDFITNSDGNFAQCMPIIGSGGYNKCPPPPKFDTTHLEAFSVDLKDPLLKACVVECSDAAEGDCPKNSVCMDAPATYKSSVVSKICQYPQPSKRLSAANYALPDHRDNYENPFVGARSKVYSACEFWEVVEYYKDQYGNTYGQCMPKISNGWYDKCPKPPKFNELRMSAYQTHTQDQDVCVLECSHSYDNACPDERECIPAPKNLQSDVVNNICVFAWQLLEQSGWEVPFSSYLM